MKNKKNKNKNKSPYIQSSSSGSFNSDLFRVLFVLLNKKYFKNNLKPVKVTAVNRKTKDILGSFNFDGPTGKNPRIFIYNSFAPNRAFSRAHLNNWSELLFHEMVHYALYLKYIEPRIGEIKEAEINKIYKQKLNHSKEWYRIYNKIVRSSRR